MVEFIPLRKIDRLIKPKNLEANSNDPEAVANFKYWFRTVKNVLGAVEAGSEYGLLCL